MTVPDRDRLTEADHVRAIAARLQAGDLSADLLDAAAKHLRALLAEITRLEGARDEALVNSVRNLGAMSHWRKRAERAEAERDKLAAAIEEFRRSYMATDGPVARKHKAERLVAALAAGGETP